MIKEIRIQIKNYSHYKKKYAFRNSNGLAPQTMALAFCMYATGMGKIDTRDDMKEFILRTILIFRHMNVFENLIIDDYLIRFKYKGREIRLVPDDFVNHTLMQLIDLKKEMPCRNEWMQKTGKERRKMNQRAALWLFTASAILPDIIHDESPGYIWLNMSSAETGIETKNAEILAECITKEIDEKQMDQNRSKSQKDKKQNEQKKEDVPFFADCWKREEPKKLTEPDKTSPAGETSGLLPNLTNGQELKDVYIPWPFAKGNARRRECHRIDPSWN